MSTCSHQPKDSCKSNSDCTWIISKGCRVRENVPLAVLRDNKKKETAAPAKKVAVKPKKAPAAKPVKAAAKPVKKPAKASKASKASA